MQLRRAFFGMVVGSIGAAGLISACATSAELGDDDDDGASTGESDASVLDSGPKKDGSASPPKGSSSSSGGKSSSSSSGGSGGNASSSGGGSSSGAPVPPAPDEGAPCTEPGKEYTRTCGLCGKQKATCFPGETAAEQVVTPYGDCENEVVDGCVPGTTEAATACGYCGTQSRTCSNSCKWTSGTCTGQQTSAQKCKVGETTIQSAGCPSGQYLTWTCRPGTGVDDPNRCTWLAPPVSQCAAPNFPYVTAPALNAVASRAIGIADQQLATRPNSGCDETTADRSLAITEIRNPTSATIKVTVYDDQKSYDRIHASYTTPPVDAATIEACVVFNDFCSITGISTTANACLGDLSIPANGKIWILSANYYDNDDDPAAAFTLNVKRTQ